MKLKTWQKSGLTWGLWMFVIMTFIWPYFDGEEVTFKKVVLGFVLWGVLGGLAFGWATRNNFNKN